MMPRVAAVLSAVARWSGLTTRGPRHLGGGRNSLTLTEAGWLAAADPTPMLDYLRDRGGAGERKLRLFAAACCRRSWRLHKNPAFREAIEATEATELYADGRLPFEGLSDAVVQADIASFGPAPRPGHYPRPDDPFREGAADYIQHALSTAKRAAGWMASGAWSGVRVERRSQAALLRDLFGNPFRPAPVLAPAVLSWNGGTVPKLAAAIYEDRAFDRLPVLADALEDAGCSDAEILAHCRSGGEHVRGCWVVDMVLGKG